MWTKQCQPPTRHLHAAVDGVDASVQVSSQRVRRRRRARICVCQPCPPLLLLLLQSLQHMDAKHCNNGRGQLDCAMLGPVILWCVSSSASTLLQSRERWRSLRVCAPALRKAHLQALGQGFCGRRCRAARLRRHARAFLCPRRRRVVHAPPPHVFSLCHLHCHDCIRRSVTLLCRTLLWNT